MENNGPVRVNTQTTHLGNCSWICLRSSAATVMLRQGLISISRLGTLLLILNAQLERFLIKEKQGVEMTDRICGILLGSNHIVPTMYPYSLKDTYKKSRLAEGIEEADIKYKNRSAVKRMLELAQTVGVQDMYRRYTCRIGGVERVDGYFEDIVKELAKGYPLMVDMMAGGKFGYLKYGQVYHCPFNNRTIKDGRTVMMHTVLLVGAARLGAHDYFYFLNSYGKCWCVRFHETERKKIGGIGKLIADDICCQPYKFLRMVQP